MEEIVIIDNDGGLYMDNAFPSFKYQPIDEHGNAVKRTKLSHPYTYDGFITFRAGPNSEANGTVYSDRLWQWDYFKTDELCYKHFGTKGQYFDRRSPSHIEAFLRDWLSDPELKLIFIMEYCNQSSGYPVWRFDYKSTKNDDVK